ncbi:shikimate kinase [Pedobacter ginsengisoli]|uniref:Shikimate kinase n=1 Tax=Pedobacter ginsengisoli TaxID=363852 RepID=A0A2D1U820_9SPHI|nr:shikimate kinase [Pedobacter ginsengisoli]ATP57742.1 shikimate kinase [Pedobacter ginsengisoli]
MKIFLIGFMGCGKSTFGKKLAVKLGYDFIDLDHVLENEVGSNIGDYFASHGEAAFRALESKVLKEYNYPENCVVATGGGAPCYFDNMDWMNNNGTTLYIEMTPIALAKRLEKGKEKRPLLKDMNEEQLIGFIESKLAERNPFYKRAALSIEGINLTPDKAVAQLF